ncbi:hypothetical protein THAOC_33315 [Thalassiosira oceanica]|uniref:Late endosomal/lysosomal adaptor and MAPK and MTOR activator 5 n=1 Tax=Thalassiosira oceanica TaxID=159749 RepID=K0RMH4_THAOC|nr:hypothetical protein THAOC_33315 [Thalassiosira oceanica]|mmetsp:Transcript_4564/g.10138  ORF Transcript_4564/g.10138 Transcript_4564/m.10138 type:complete len:129 (-) Transcript_4564:63-449(-)|eukprot:EJK47932.1 hypothetical protein THAOC_33315 [Thalassiosira oceanica]
MADEKGMMSGLTGVLAAKMADGGGCLVNDSNGLCLGSAGNIDASRASIFTSISKLAGQLDSSVDGSGSGIPESPLVTIQTDDASLLVKEYGGNKTVVFRVPNAGAESNNSDAGAVAEATTDDGSSKQT